jgi:hypothetical protein
MFLDDHRTVLDAVEKRTGKTLKLVLIGGSRNRGDEQRVEALKQRAKQLKLDVRFP